MVTLQINNKEINVSKDKDTLEVLKQVKEKFISDDLNTFREKC